MDSLSQMTTDKLKSFWAKPEGKTGMIFLAGLGIVGVIVMMKWGADLVAAAQNTFILAGYVAAAVLIVMGIMNGRIQALGSMIFKSVMRGITGMFIKIDPIGILKDYIEDLEENHEKMNVQITKLKGSIRSLRDTISKNITIAKDQMSLAAQAKKSGNMQAQVILKTRKAGRLQNSNRTYQDLLNKIEVIYRVLCKMYENCGILIEDTKDDVDQKEIEWKTTRQAYSAMKSAMSVINGNKDKRAIFEQTLEYMASDLEQKVGEMERFMEMSENFMQGVDLQNGVFEEKGMEMLEKWEKDADSWLLTPDEKKQLVNDGNNPAVNVNIDIPVGVQQSVARDSNLSKLFQ